MILEIESEDIYNDILNDHNYYIGIDKVPLLIKDHFDFSEYPNDHFLKNNDHK